MKYLLPQEILYIHNRINSELNGKDGTTDPRIIKKVVSYMKNNDAFSGVFEKAGALLFAIARKKPFVSNNTISGFLIVSIFLNLNKKDLDLADPGVLDFAKRLLPTATVGEIASWLRDCSESLS